jgi:putative FmdB family regulatory protein
MPLYEYLCGECERRFETLVMGSNGDSDVRCPGCAGARVERQFSVFAVSSSSSSDAPMSAGGCGRCGDPRGPGACRAS